MKRYISPLLTSFALCTAAVSISASTAAQANAQTAAADSDVDDASMAKIDILPGWTMENGHRMAAIRIQLAPGWHTYWRAPGEAGIPPSFDWSGSENIKSVSFHWPTPNLFSDNGMWYLGYEHELILPIEFTPDQEGAIHISGEMALGVCKDICMPLTAQLNATLTAEGGQPSIRAALKDRPTPMKNARCSAAALSDGMQITASLSVPETSGQEVAVIEHPDKSIWVSEAMLKRSGTQMEITSDLVPAQAQPFVIDRSDLTITVVSGGQVFEAQGCTGG